MKFGLYLQLAHLSYIIILPAIFLLPVVFSLTGFGTSLASYVVVIFLFSFVFFTPLSIVWFIRGIAGVLYNTSRFGNVLLGTVHLLLGLLGVGFILGMLSR